MLDDLKITPEKLTEEYARKVYPTLYPKGVPVPKQTIERFAAVGQFCFDKMEELLKDVSNLGK